MNSKFHMRATPQERDSNFHGFLLMGCLLSYSLLGCLSLLLRVGRLGPGDMVQVSEIYCSNKFGEFYI